MARADRERGGPPPIGKAAFDAHVSRISEFITIRDADPDAREAARALTSARQWVEAGDYLEALHAMGGLKLSVTNSPAPDTGRTAGDVEQALADLRRAVERAGTSAGAVQAAALWRAAREELIAGSWDVAVALIDEANAWLRGGP